MDTVGFKNWLSTEYLQINGEPLAHGTQESRVANCNTVEQIEGNLDHHFQRDAMAALLEGLSYSLEDAREGKPANHSIPIHGDIVNGTATLKSAVKLYQKFLIAQQAMAPTVEDNAETQKEIAEIERSNLRRTQKQALIMSRIGQGIFRHSVLEIWNYKCAVTKAGILLCASHIKPWNLSDNRERLDPFNGLALSPVFDKAFDVGLITFSKTGKVLLSQKLSPCDAEVLGLQNNLCIEGLSADHAPYLEFHQRYVWQKPV